MSEIDITADKVAYKVVDLFGNEQIMFSKREAKNNKTLFDSYEEFVRELDDQKKHKKAIFGSGYLVNPKLIRYSTPEAEEMPTAGANTIEWELSERELNIIKSLK